MQDPHRRVTWPPRPLVVGASVRESTGSDCALRGGTAALVLAVGSRLVGSTGVLRRVAVCAGAA